MTPAEPTVIAGQRPSVVERLWPPAPESAGGARRFLALHLAAWGLPQLRDCAGLVVSELVTNAVVHGQPPFGELITTRFVRCGCSVRIEVHDASDHGPELRQASPDEESGRGLGLVDLLTEGRWGVKNRKEPGKTVWAVCADPGHTF